MGLFRNRLHRRFPLIGLLSDLALVGTAANRLARRRSRSGQGGSMSGVEMALASGAAFRLVQRARRRRKRRRPTRAVEVS